jgi:hypothetical protein
MSDSQPEETSGIVTSDSVVSEHSGSSKRPHRIRLWLLVGVGLLALVVFGVYWYNQNIKRTTAENAEQVIQKFESSLRGGKVAEGSGSVLSAYQPQGQGYFVKPGAAKTIEYTVKPDKIQKNYDKARRTLDRLNLEGKKTSNTQVGKTPSMYYENASVHCHLGVQEIEKDYVLRVSCANMSAYTEAAKQIQVFYDLYAQNNPEAKTIQGIDVSSLKDSLSKGYKTAEITIVKDNTPEGAVNALYYQTSDGTWHYFKATLLEIYCEEYNTPDIQKAFIGKPCYDANMNFSSVKP